MRRFSRPMIVASATAILLAFGFGLIAVLSTSTAEAGGPCRCPLIYAPVQCDHGKVYPNQCVADCHNAKNCVPTGEL